MDFVKMQGLGNDFVVVGADVQVDAKLVRHLCDRRFGVGGDGVLQVSSIDGLVHMGYWNADGSAAEMCGNGLRCVARRAVDLRLVSAPEFIVQTPIGPRRAIVRRDETVAVDLGPVAVGERRRLEGFEFTSVDVGNPHAVARTDPDGLLLHEIGPKIEHHPSFPSGTNVEFYRVDGPHSVAMRVWERGVGETLACGTGMVAVAASARSDGAVVGDSITVEVPGGRGIVEFADGVWLVGPATTVFEGSVAVSEPS